MGNSHLRLEDMDTAAQEAAAEEELPTFEVEEVPEEAAAPAEEAEVVVSLLAEEGEAAAATAVGDVAVAEDKAHPLPANRLRELVGHALAHFQIEGEIGMGHCSMLFRALDFKKDKTVVLKVLPPDFPHSDEEMQRRTPGGLEDGAPVAARQPGEPVCRRQEWAVLLARHEIH